LNEQLSISRAKAERKKNNQLALDMKEALVQYHIDFMEHNKTRINFSENARNLDISPYEAAKVRILITSEWANEIPT
jgi:hypothetical protein